MKSLIIELLSKDNRITITFDNGDQIITKTLIDKRTHDDSIIVVENQSNAAPIVINLKLVRTVGLFRGTTWLV